MNAEEFEKMLLEQDHQLLKKVVLPEHESLLQAIRALFPTTGILQNMFCNGFMTESVELIKHALFLYEDGYFDCAFYSLYALFLVFLRVYDSTTQRRSPMCNIRICSLDNRLSVKY